MPQEDVFAVWLGISFHKVQEVQWQNREHSRNVNKSRQFSQTTKGIMVNNVVFLSSEFKNSISW